MNSKKIDNLEVNIYDTREEMGKFSAQEAIQCIQNLLEKKTEVNCVFAAAPSQSDFLQELCKTDAIDWSRVNAFHMDEYLGLPIGSENSFSGFLNNAIFDKKNFKATYLLDGTADPEEEIERYTKLLHDLPVDVVFMGIGENGHIAFNDPGVAEFNDKALVKIVELEEPCKQQQVNDGAFPSIDKVPTHALTLTIPALINPEHIFCMVPNIRKAAAVKASLQGPITEECPASILRTKKNAKLYLDKDSASLL